MPETTMQDTTTAVDPEPVFRVASGFMAAKHLFAAAELGVFAGLGDGPLTLGELAARLDLSPRTTRISADAMVALGFVERDGDAYRNGRVAAGYLSGRGPADLRPFLRFWDRISYPNWARLRKRCAPAAPRSSSSRPSRARSSPPGSRPSPQQAPARWPRRTRSTVIAAFWTSAAARARSWSQP
jgi:hypothetical protein